MSDHDQDIPVCVACGSQYDFVDGEPPERCKICDDPRQFVLPDGQQWTSLARLREEGHKNKWEKDPNDERITWFWTEPKVAIGQRAFIIATPVGLIMWDLVPFLDSATIEHINSFNQPLLAIIISHPHYYSTYATWSAAFSSVPIYIASDDTSWLCRSVPSGATLKTIDGPVGTQKEVVDGSHVTVIKAGGHFSGSLLLHSADADALFIADTIVTVPSAYSPHPRPKGQTTYSFMWSIPNIIPMTPDEIWGIWKSVKGLKWGKSYGAFRGMDVRDDDMRERLLESMKIQVRTGGWSKHGLLDENVDA